MALKVFINSCGLLLKLKLKSAVFRENMLKQSYIFSGNFLTVFVVIKCDIYFDIKFTRLNLKETIN